MGLINDELNSLLALMQKWATKCKHTVANEDAEALQTGDTKKIEFVNKLRTFLLALDILCLH